MLAAAALLHVWESGQRTHPAARSLQLLAHALPDRERDALAGVEIAIRDWHLLRLRQQWFGSAIASYAECPACGERMEVECDAEAIAGDCPGDAPPYVSHDGCRFRLPTVGDLIDVAELDADAAAQRLLAQCCIDDATSRADLRTLFDEVDAGLAGMAAERGFFLALTCTQCGAPSRHALDPADYLWAEVSAAAAALLEEVHVVASAYGWAERDILAMSPVRRQAYARRIES